MVEIDSAVDDVWFRVIGDEYDQIAPAAVFVMAYRLVSNAPRTLGVLR